MNDPQIHGTIEKLVAEEHELWQRESGGGASDYDRRRLEQVKVSLDQCWDLLRQRRAACAPRAGIPKRQSRAGRRSWSATSSSSAREATREKVPDPKKGSGTR